MLGFLVGSDDGWMGGSDERRVNRTIGCPWVEQARRGHENTTVHAPTRPFLSYPTLTPVQHTHLSRYCCVSLKYVALSPIWMSCALHAAGTQTP